MKTIGIVEDDAVLARELQYFLKTNGYEAEVVGTESMDARALVERGYHMLLLDIGLPGTDGLHLCREIRRISELPVIMITSRNTELTELMSMNNGADAFVAKPFNPQILLVRMEAILKRVYKEHRTDVRELGCFSFDMPGGRITGKEGSEELTRNEIRMLSVLADRQGSIVTRDEIINALWDDKLFVDDNTLTVNMTRLKAKLESVGAKGVIVTKRGMGYQLL